MSFWKKKQITQLNSDEFEQLTKKVVALVGDIDTLSHRIEVVHSIVKSNRARINQIKSDKIVSESEKDINDDTVYLGEGRMRP